MKDKVTIVFIGIPAKAPTQPRHAPAIAQQKARRGVRLGFMRSFSG
jgi:hypothetical protein